MHFCMQEVAIIAGAVVGIRHCWHWICAKWRSL